MADPELNADGTPKEPVESKGDPKGAAPAIDMDALGEMMNKKVKEGVQEALSQVNPGPRPQQGELGKPAQDPLGDMVRGYIAPDLQATRMAVEDAKDFGSFYAKGDEDEREWKREKSTEIEDIFGKMLKAGRPMSREDIAQWVKGKEPEKVVEFKATRQRKRMEQVQGTQSGIEAGSSAPRGIPAGKDPYDMSEEELGKTMAGKWF
jgi:hypothetical protein